METIDTAHGALPLPAFLPDATRGTVKTLAPEDVAACGVRAVMANAFHLSGAPGAEAIASVGGLHGFMGWDGPIFTDSGGFQVYSLLTNDAKLGSIIASGFIYRAARGQAKRRLTPEKAIQKQWQLGADVLFCLDHCTHPSMPAEAQRESVAHTLAWAAACKAEFDRRMQSRAANRKLFAIVQGGPDAALRRHCAEGLQELGFDGYGFGGWPVDDTGGLVEAVHQVAELTPHNMPLHGLGIGKPEHVAAAVRWGYHSFDCVLPTRDARHKRLYIFTDMQQIVSGADFYTTVYIDRADFARDGRPVEEGCDCPACRRYSRAFLHHLFQINDPAGLRLATQHNLRFYQRLVENLQTCLGPRQRTSMRS
ncbi:MAG: tRNA guanosine(34) transglycosylase Tgt [Candidatus Hydrogenedentales bacterium]